MRFWAPWRVGVAPAGLLCRAADPGDLAEKLTMLIQNRQLRKDLGARAAEFARTRLTIEIAVERSGEIYENPEWAVFKRSSKTGLRAVTSVGT